MMWMMATTTQHPGERAKNSNQRHDDSQAGKYVLTNSGSRQAVGEGIEHRIVNTVSGKIVAGVEGNVQNNKNAEYHQRGDKPPGVTAGFPGVNADGS